MIYSCCWIWLIRLAFVFVLVRAWDHFLYPKYPAETVYSFVSELQADKQKRALEAKVDRIPQNFISLLSHITEMFEDVWGRGIFCFRRRGILLANLHYSLAFCHNCLELFIKYLSKFYFAGICGSVTGIVKLQSA